MTYQELLSSVVTEDKFTLVKPYHTDEALNFIKDIMSSEESQVIIMGDWDVDGVHAAKIVYNDLKEFGLRDDMLKVYFGESKSHGINSDFLRFCQDNSCTHIIIVDSSSNNLKELSYLKDSGFKIMVIDHHVSQYSYEDYEGICTIVNAKLPDNEEICEISAGFLCAILSYYWREALDVAQTIDNFIYGYITLHSDSCLLYDPFMKPLVMYPERLGNRFPLEIEPFTTKYTKLNRNFVSWTYCPKINNLCRHNRSDLLELLFFKPITPTERSNLVEIVNDLYKKTKEDLDRLIEESDNYVYEHNGMVLANLDKALQHTTLKWDYLVNSTGLVASRVSEKYKKPALAYINNHFGEYKMSGRDCNNSINFQNMLKAYNLDGGGHIYAVGFVVPLIDFNTFLKQIDISSYTVTESDFFVWDFTKLNPIKIKSYLGSVARYNEVATGKLKPIYFKLKLNFKFEEKQIGKLRTFTYAGLKIKDLKSQTTTDTEVLIRPDITNMGEAFIVYEEEKK